LESIPAASASPTGGLDGGVLDLKVDGGSWQDILAAGGSFSSGAYTAQITNSGSNPLQGRMGWTGSSGGFINTLVNLPTNIAGHDIQLRWVLGSNNGNTNGGTGWFVDSVTINDSYHDCCNTLVAPTLNVSLANPNLVLVSFASLADQTYTLQRCTNLAAPVWVSLQSFVGNGSSITVSNTCTNSAGFYRLVSP
jgi:hypothetical protein